MAPDVRGREQAVVELERERGERALADVQDGVPQLLRQRPDRRVRGGRVVRHRARACIRLRARRLREKQLCARRNARSDARGPRARAPLARPRKCRPGGGTRGARSTPRALSRRARQVETRRVVPGAPEGVGWGIFELFASVEKASFKRSWASSFQVTCVFAISYGQTVCLEGASGKARRGTTCLASPPAPVCSSHLWRDRVVPSRLCAGVDRRAARLGTRARASRDASPRALLRHALSSGPRVASPPSPAMLRHAVSQFSARAATMGVGAAAASAPGAAECAKKEDASKTVTSSFDPEALERGAKALREINNSIHAKKVRAIAALAAGRDRPRDRSRRRRAIRRADRRSSPILDSARADARSRLARANIP